MVQGNFSRNFFGTAPVGPTAPLKEGSVWEGYKGRFHALTAEGLTSGIVAKIRNLLRYRPGHRQANYDLVWGIHIAADHIPDRNRESWKNTPKTVAQATRMTVAHLEKLSPSPQVHTTIAALEYAAKIDARINDERIHLGHILPDTALRIPQDIERLEVGASLAIPSNTPDHAMILWITRTENVHGGKRYKVIQHNEGSGLGKYHYNKVDSNGQLLYQTALEIPDVRLDFLSYDFFQKLLEVRGSKKRGQEAVDVVYALLKTLGCPADPSPDPRLWSPGQLGGSCTAKCGLSAVRSQLPEKQYQAFMELAQYEILFKSIRQIRSGWGNTSLQKLVSLEVIKQIEHRFKQEKQALPTPIQQIKDHLSPQVSSKVRRGAEKTATFGLADYLRATFTHLKKGNLTQKEFENAAPFLKIANELGKSIGTHARENAGRELRKEEIKDAHKLIKIAIQITRHFKNKPLSIEQTYIITALMTPIGVSVGAICKTKNAEKYINFQDTHEITEFAWKMHVKFNGLQCGAYCHHPDFDERMRDVQEQCFLQEGPQMPKELQAWRQGA